MAEHDIDTSRYSLLNPGPLSDPGDRHITFADVLAQIPRSEDGSLLLNAAGVSSTEIRIALGERGSFSTITKHLKTIRALDQQSREPKTTGELPEAPASLIDAIWQEAYLHAKSHYAARGEVVAHKLLDATSNIEVLEGELTQLSEALDKQIGLTKEAQAAQIEASEKLSTVLQESVEKANTHQAEIDKLNAKISEMEAAHQLAIKDLMAGFDREKLEWKAARAELVATQQQLTDRVIELRAFEKYIQEHHKVPPQN